jgi:hypothetical protein
MWVNLPLEGTNSHLQILYLRTSKVQPVLRKLMAIECYGSSAIVQNFIVRRRWSRMLAELITATQAIHLEFQFRRIVQHSLELRCDQLEDSMSVFGDLAASYLEPPQLARKSLRSRPGLAGMHPRGAPDSTTGLHSLTALGMGFSLRRPDGVCAARRLEPSHTADESLPANTNACRTRDSACRFVQQRSGWVSFRSTRLRLVGPAVSVLKPRQGMNFTKEGKTCSLQEMHLQIL